jgi:hypothetical protein
MLAKEITFRHLLDFIDGVGSTPAQETQETEYANQPNELTVPVATIVAGGTDLNAPKNPADIRADSVSMYPNHQHKAGN